MSDRKAEILDVAKTVFAERGVKASTVREIGARAGILSGSLYHHFASKTDIVDEILSEFTAEVLARYREIEKTDVDSIERLQLMARLAFSLIPEHSAAERILLNDSNDLITDKRFAYLIEFNTEVQRYWVKAVRSGIKAGSIKADVDPEVFYRFARDAILGAIRWYRPSGGHGIERLADQFNSVMLLGIVNQ